METLIQRRTFVGTLLILPMGTFLLSCSSEDENYGSSSSDKPAAEPQRSGTQTTYTSSQVSEHFHAYTLQDAELTAGMDIDVVTEVGGGHTHPLHISGTDLKSVSDGQTVKITTGSASSHTHVFTLVKVS